MARKAKNAPPWTRRKLVAYRRKKEKERAEERKHWKDLLAGLDKSRAGIDKATEGCQESG